MFEFGLEGIFFQWLVHSAGKHKWFGPMVNIKYGVRMNKHQEIIDNDFCFVSGIGCPNEVVEHYLYCKNSNKFMIESNFNLFKNELIIDSVNAQQDQKYVLEILNCTKYIIHCDDTLFFNLINADQKLLNQFYKRKL